MCLMKVGMERKDVSTSIQELFKFIQQIHLKINGLHESWKVSALDILAILGLAM